MKSLLKILTILTSIILLHACHGAKEVEVSLDRANAGMSENPTLSLVYRI